MNEILATSDGGVLTLTLNRPAKMNALTKGMYSSLAEHLRQAVGDFGIRAVVIKADGDTNLRVLLALAYRTHYGDKAFERLGVACQHMELGPDGKYVCTRHI